MRTLAKSMPPALLLMPGLASCQAEDGPVRPGDAGYPELNPNPTHVVQGSGAIAPMLAQGLESLQIRITQQQAELR